MDDCRSHLFHVHCALDFCQVRKPSTPRRDTSWPLRPIEGGGEKSQYDFSKKNFKKRKQRGDLLEIFSKNVSKGGTLWNFSQKPKQRGDPLEIFLKKRKQRGDPLEIFLKKRNQRGDPLGIFSKNVAFLLPFLDAYLMGFCRVPRGKSIPAFLFVFTLPASCHCYGIRSTFWCREPPTRSRTFYRGVFKG